MATVTHVLGKPNKSGQRRISIVISHRGSRKRITTNIYIDSMAITDRYIKKDFTQLNNANFKVIDYVLDTIKAGG